MGLKSPNWNNKEDRELYKKLFYCGNETDKSLTEIEKQFCQDMYIMEEFACGLDGD